MKIVMMDSKMMVMAISAFLMMDNALLATKMMEQQ